MSEQPYEGKSIRVADWVPAVDVIVDDSGAHADGDLLAQAVKLTFALKERGVSFLHTATVIDYDAQGANMNLLFFSENPGSLGTLNSATVMGVPQAAICLGNLTISSWLTVGARSIGSPSSPKSIALYSTDGTQSVWMAVQSAGAGTYASEKLTIKPGLLRG